MKDIAELAGLFGTYPVFVRAFAVVWVVVSAALVALLVIYYPKTPEFSVDSARWIQTANGLNGVDIQLRNRLGETAVVTEIELHFLNQTRPTGGLQSANAVSATYSVFQGDEGQWQSAGEDKLTSAVRLLKPFSTDAYTRVSVPVSQTVKDSESDRIVIVISAEDFPDDLHDRVEVVAVYNAGHKSAPAQGLIN